VAKIALESPPLPRGCAYEPLTWHTVNSALIMNYAELKRFTGRLIYSIPARASAENISRAEKIVGRKKLGQWKKRPKNSTIKPLSTIYVPCIKIQERAMYKNPLTPRPPYAPRCRRPWVYGVFFFQRRGNHNALPH